MIDMINQAISKLGKKARLEEIQKYIQNNFQQELNGFSWKNTLLDCLKIHFVEVPSDERRGTIWIPVNEENKNNKYKITKQFDAPYLATLKAQNPQTPLFSDFSGIHFINRTSPLGLDYRSPLQHNSPIYSMDWSHNGRNLVTGGNCMTIWNVDTWKKTKEISSHANEEHFYTVSFSPNDKKLLGAGKVIVEGVESYPIKVKYKKYILFYINGKIL